MAGHVFPDSATGCVLGHEQAPRKVSAAKVREERHTYNFLAENIVPTFN